MRSIGYSVTALGLLGLFLWLHGNGPRVNQGEDAFLVEESSFVPVESNSDVEQPRLPIADQATEGFRFPDDPAGQMLSKILTPSEKKPQPYPSSQPRMLSAPPAVEDPVLPMPQAHFEVARLPQTKRPLIKLRPLPEEPPILGSQLIPELPQARVLAAGDRVRLASVDPRLPLPLPILAQPMSDRVPIEDVTGDASRTSVLASSPPTRTSPAPFTKTRVPDPFENRLKTP
jgi:hypothetical protein